MKIVMGLNPISPRLGKKIEELVQNQPSYDPFSTIEEDIKRLAVPQAKERGKITKPEKSRVVEFSETEEKSLHDTTKNMIFEIGKWEGRYAEIEYEIANLGKLDVVWKRIKTGHPAYAFEVQIKGNFYQALAKLKHAFDLWNSIPILVTTQDFVTQAEELLSGSFHEMGKQARIIDYEKIRVLFSLEKELHWLKEELDL